MGTFLPVGFYVDLCRLGNDHVTDGAALLALLADVAPPAVLADAAAAALLA